MASIIDYLENNSEILNRGNYPNIGIECPSCGNRAGKFTFSAEKGVGRCFRASCDYRCNFPQLICKIERISLKDGILKAQKYSDGLSETYKIRKTLRSYGYPKGSAPLLDIASNPDLYSKEAVSIAEAGCAYLLNNRKVSSELIEKYSLGVGFDGELYGFIVIPVTLNENIVTYTCRGIQMGNSLLSSCKQKHPSIDDDYLTIHSVPFNCDIAFEAATKEPLKIVEDVWSAMKLKSAIALNGAALSEDQIYVLRENYKGEIVVLMDGDDAGRNASSRIALKLSKYYPNLRVGNLPEGYDPDDDLEITKQTILEAEEYNSFSGQLNSRIRQ